MGVYIKGMEMPRERESFQVTIKYNGIVLDTETGIQVAEAYEVPPHGRLIDADALEEDYWKADGEPMFSESRIKAAPTIIEAEEKE